MVQPFRPKTWKRIMLGFLAKWRNGLWGQSAPTQMSSDGRPQDDESDDSRARQRDRISQSGLIFSQIKHLSPITDSLPYLISYINPDHRYAYHNKTYRHWFGGEYADILERHVSEVLGPTAYGQILPQLTEALQGDYVSFDCPLAYKSGGPRHVQIIYIPDRTATDEIAGVVTIVSDVSERKRIEEELIEAKIEAEESNHAKSAFLANMSHEIRTPLCAIVGFADFLLEPEVTEADRLQFAATIKRNSRSLAHLIDDILDLSKVEAGKVLLEHIEFGVFELVSGVIKTLEPQADAKGIELTCWFDPTLPKTMVSDPTRIKQVLLNIIGNALKFTLQGKVEVKIEVNRDNSPLVFNFIVKDSGIGIPPIVQKRIFEPFVQADSSTTRKFGGTGLGLALSRRLARLLGGEVKLLESTLGVGTTFVISIPSQTLTKSIPKSSGSGQLQKSQDLAGIRILLAEDSQDNQLLIHRILASQCAEVKIVANGKSALEEALRSDYDLVLMDIQMPVMDGFTSTRELRARGFDKPIIALTAHAMKEEREKSLGAGCNEHLSKPISIDQLMSAVKQFVGRPHSGAIADLTPD